MQRLPNNQQRRADALTVIANPRPEHSYGLRLFSWAYLKGERGQTVRQSRLQTKQIRVDRPLSRTNAA